jgi:lysophospholipase L1-like esterase
MRRVLLAVLFTFLVAAAPAWAQTSAPSRMASIGDSITRATDVCCWYGDHPRHSWSTGGAPFDGIRSHYERLRALEPALSGNNHNDARRGARMRDAPSQAQAAVTQQAEYVTVLMGANDVCTSSPSTMTTVADFRARFTETMQVLTTGLPPGSRVFVSSIPNVYRLWQVLRDSPAAQLVWSVARICQSMLSQTNTEADRQAVLSREQAFNGVLADVCGQYASCRFDGGAVFEYPFTRAHVSRLDYFHPNLAGQAVLASVTWERSWWGSA